MNSKREVFSAKPLLKVVRFDATTATEDEAKITLRGYPIVWNSLSNDRGGYKFRFLKGSVTVADPCVALWAHEMRLVIGNTDNGSLRILPADDYGLPVEITLPGTSYSNDVATLVEEKYVNGMSWGMPASGFEFETLTEGDFAIIEVISGALCDEVSVLVNPAFVDTTIEVKDNADTEVKDISAETKERDVQSLKLENERLRQYGL